MEGDKKKGPVINAIIVEDDAFNCNLLWDLLIDNFTNIHILGTAPSLQKARILLAHNRIDLLFLDIELPDGKGFDLLTSDPEVNFEVIFTTSFSQYALDAIRHSALDYLIKPVKLPDLDAAICRFMKKFSGADPLKSYEISSKPTTCRIPVPTADGYVFLAVEDIVHLEANRAYSVFHLKNGKKILVSKPMSDFEERLVSRNFLRVHNSHIINLRLVIRYIRGIGGQVIMCNDAVVPVSRNHKEEFLEAIGDL